MATIAKATSSSSCCLSFLKDALLLPTRNAKLFAPILLLVTIPTFLLQITNVFRIEPLTAAISLRIDAMENVDPSSPGYATLTAEFFKEARELATIAIPAMVVAVVWSSANQIVALFAASTTYSGDRYSLSQLFSTATAAKGRRLIIRGPLITVAMVTALDVALTVLLAALQLLLHLAMRISPSSSEAAFYAEVLLSVFASLSFLYLNVVFTVAVAVSVADAECRGVGALRRAWRLMTRVRRKEGCVLAAVVCLLAMAPSPLEDVAREYSKKSTPVVLAVLFVSALLSGLVDLFYFAAVTVYYYQAMEDKEVMAHGYVKVPTGEATV